MICWNATKSLQSNKACLQVRTHTLVRKTWKDHLLPLGLTQTGPSTCSAFGRALGGQAARRTRRRSRRRGAFLGQNPHSPASHVCPCLRPGLSPAPISTSTPGPRCCQDSAFLTLKTHLSGCVLLAVLGGLGLLLKILSWDSCFYLNITNIIQPQELFPRRKCEEATGRCKLYQD